jgi:hypothetical protein
MTTSAQLTIRFRRATRIAAAAVVCYCAPPAVGQIFSNVTAAAGITHNATRPFDPDNPTFVPSATQEQSGGAAAGDFDGDGWPDLYVTRYWDTDILYRNDRDGTFSDVTATAIPGGIGVHDTNGAAWGDVDNDGDLDLMVSTMYESRHLLYINDGAGHFAEEGGTRGIQLTTGLPTTSGSGVAMGDYDGDGYLDMYVTEWRGFETNNLSNPSQARLYRNQGAANPGHFVDVTAAAGASMDLAFGPNKNKAFSFTPRFTDLDRDGHVDLAVVSDAGTSRLFWNNGDGTFINRTAAAGINTGTNDMGFTLADFNGDGLLDWFATSIGFGTNAHPSGNRLLLNNGNRTFTDVTSAAGVREGGWGWGAEAFDFDHDGLIDIFHTNGYSIAPVDQTIVFHNVGTRTTSQFANVADQVGVTDAQQGRGLLTFDYDRDGDLDVFIVNYSTPPILYRNDAGAFLGDWLEVRAIGTESNRDGVGAFITLTPDASQPDAFIVAEIDGSSNYLGQSEGIAHFGLGQLDAIDQIDVLWPSGYLQRFTNVAPNQLVTITEGLLADFNGDDRVDGDDLAMWRLHDGMASGATPADGDADRDGDVDGADLLAWQRTVGRSVKSGLAGATPLAAVPEPTCLALAAAVCVFFIRRRLIRLRLCQK